MFDTTTNRQLCLDKINKSINEQDNFLSAVFFIYRFNLPKDFSGKKNEIVPEEVLPNYDFVEFNTALNKVKELKS